jgi:hypothetical protein
VPGFNRGPAQPDLFCRMGVGPELPQQVDAAGRVFRQTQSPRRTDSS